MVSPACDQADSSLAALMQLAVRLVDVEASADPPSQPYRSLYAARDLLKSVRAQLDASHDAAELSRARRACVLLYLGRVAVQTDEVVEGEACLLQCVGTCCLLPADTPLDFSKTVAVPPTSHTSVLSLLEALNTLGLLWSERGESRQSREALSLSERTYSAYNQQSDSPVPSLPGQLFGFEDPPAEPSAGERKLQQLHTLTLFYLSQALLSAGEHGRSAEYLHRTLARQLSAGAATSLPDRVEWARNAATLSRFYTDGGRFSAARHHLAAADRVLGDAAARHADENVRRCDADVARNWTHLSLALLQTSTDRLLSSEPPEDTLPAGPEFVELDVSAGEAQTAVEYVQTFEEARPVFLCGQRALERACRFYTLEEHAGDHIELARLHSRLYKALVFFEPDLQRQCQLYRRRIRILAPVLSQLSLQHYLSPARQLQYEVAEVYSEIAQCKVELQRERDKLHLNVTRHVVDKINMLMRSSIAYFDQFLDTIRVGEDRNLPAVIEDDLTRPVLIAFFHLGHLYNRIMETELAPKLANLERSLDAYRFIVDYCQREASAAEKMADELTACREMARLLPARLDQVREAIKNGSTLATQIQYQ